MIILGVNGWYERGHDACACLVENGQLITAVEEERLIHHKHAYDTMPFNAIGWCLSQQSISVDELDAVAVGWNIPKLYQLHEQKLPFRDDEEYLDILFPRKFFGTRSRKIPVYFVDHHQAHAASTFYLSGLADALVMVVDGQGEDTATSIWKGESGLLRLITSFPVNASLGYFFEAASTFVGFASSHAGKTMGLAAYGSPLDVELFRLEKGGYDLIGNPLVNHSRDGLDEQSVTSRYWEDKLAKIFGEPNFRRYSFSSMHGQFIFETPLSQRERDVAALVQRETERVVLHLLREYTLSENTRNVCLAGGVALNCSCNGKVLLSGLVDNLFIQPAAHDAGVAIGAALNVAAVHGEYPSLPLNTASLGPAYTDGDIVNFLQRVGFKPRISHNVSQDTAKLLANGKVVGWFQGGGEVGPRALGNRSILSDPRTSYMRDKTNHIKGRESWRPLSPSILAEKTEWLIGTALRSPFMLLGLPVLRHRHKTVAGAVHVDGTSRIQTVEETQERYYHLLVEFEKLTGVPMVLNTSFNGPGEPIVCTPVQALHCFCDRPLDALVIGNCILKKG